MTRFPLISLLAFILVGISQATPLAEQLALQPDDTVHTTDSWDYADCGKLIFNLARNN